MVLLFLFRIDFVEVSWIDLLDIFLVAILLFRLFILIRGSVASKILVGGLIFYALYLVVRTFGLELLSSVLGQFVAAGVLVALILFQQEMRKFLMEIGRANVLGKQNIFKLLWKGGYADHVDAYNLEEIVSAAYAMAKSRPEPTGALIVFAGGTDLKFYVETGDLIDAEVSERLLLSIFNKYSPLHDGAVIIGRNGRIVAARCIMPVSENPKIPASLGLRHRAALGITEETDAVALVVSEQTGYVSLVKAGEIQRNLNETELKEKLIRYLLLHEDEETDATQQPVPPNDPVKAS
ncbi:MAG TPA: TIGR00159 family protein [Microscillaceae bacterium]|jgi:uncharacterized protein (TIGR00159 family)|nr:TIGR00159 family protein [Microscillaceae bacterium]